MECAETRARSSYRASLGVLLAALAALLLALLDVRRGFLFAGYPVRTPWALLHPGQGLLGGAGLAGLLIAWRVLARREREIDAGERGRHVRWLALALGLFLVADLFTYRGVAAARSLASGKVSSAWFDAFGVADWARPFALVLSYLLTVWHATLLGVLLAGLALVALPQVPLAFAAREGFRGSLAGTLSSLAAPFCSCCSSVLAPSLARCGASPSYTLAFVVGSPSLNVTAIALALALLPVPYALLRILAGAVLAVAATGLAARLGGRPSGPPKPPGAPVRWAAWWGELYARFVRPEALAEAGSRGPSAFLAAWLSASARLGLILVPALALFGLASAVLLAVLPPAFGNNPASVVCSAAVGTLLMIPTWGEIPMALEMIRAGYTGPAAALLVVLPPVSLPCLAILAGAFQRLLSVAVLGLLVAAAGVLAGFVFL